MKIHSGDIALNVETSGPKTGAPLILLHEFGTDIGLWDEILPRLPVGLFIVRIDLRGHGKSDVGKAPYSMGALVRDVEVVLSALNLRDAVVMGLGLGGMIAQGLAVKRLDQVRALILCNSAAKIGHAPHWQAMIDEVNAKGADELAARMMSIWFHRAALNEGLQDDIQCGFQKIDPEGLVGSFHALSSTDFYTPTSGLRLSCLGIGGAEDRFVPPDMTRETSELVPGAEFALLRKSGHLPPIDQPEKLADIVTNFLKRIGHH